MGMNNVAQKMRVLSLFAQTNQIRPMYHPLGLNTDYFFVGNNVTKVLVLFSRVHFKLSGMRLLKYGF